MIAQGFAKVKRFFGGRREIDMTEGSIVKNLLLFALPLFAGNLFQQLYNMVDTWVIGQAEEIYHIAPAGAYAAVGSVGPIINILIGFFSGLASGAGVVISQHFGAKDTDGVRRAVHTACTMTLILTAAFTVIGVAGTPLMLRLMLRTVEASSDEIYPLAKTYLTIYFAGMVGLLFYNMGSGILRAVGDSNRPFYYLVVSAVTNIVLDFLFVFGFRMGVAGVALATIVAQAISAVLTVLTLLRTPTCVRVCVRDLGIDGAMLRMIVRVGFPAALQMALTAFSNVFVQSYISNVSGGVTLYGETTIKRAALGGWTTYSKVDQFIFLPIQSLALAATTFVGQNLGTGNVRRAKRGTYLAYLMGVIATVTIMIPMMIFAPAISAFFNPDPSVVDSSTLLLRYITPFYMFSCVNQIFSGALRGAGNSRAPMIIMLSSFVAFRQVYLFMMSTYISNDLLPIAMGYPAGWGCCCLLTMIYFFCFFRFEKGRLTAGRSE